MSSPAAASSDSKSVAAKKERPPLRWNPAHGPEPVISPDMTEVEKNAVRKLLDEQLLLYNCPDRTCPFRDIATWEKADECWNMFTGDPQRPRNLSDSSTIIEEKELAKRVAKLKTELLENVGGDVIAGTIFALNVPDEKSEKNFDRLKSEFDKLAKPGQDFDPGSSFGPDELATTAFTIVAGDKEFTFPMLEENVKDLIYGAYPSDFGIAGEGNHYDESVRKSWEYVIPLPKPSRKSKPQKNDDDNDDNDGQDNSATESKHNQFGVDEDCPLVKLPPWLYHPRHYFPKLERAIRERLCPNAGEIAIVPYKLVCYAEDDFFDMHRDSVNDPRHFGTLSIDLPMEGSYSDSTPFPFDPESYEYDDEGDEKAEERKEEFGEKPADERRAEGGGLRFFLGRGGRIPHLYSEANVGGTVSNTFDCYKYGRQPDCTSQLACQVYFQNYTQEELEGKYSPASASASRLAEPRRKLDGTPITEEEYQRWKKLQEIMEGTDEEKSEPKKKKSWNDRTPDPSDAHPPKPGFSKNGRKHTPLKFAAWLTDVHHDVRPVLGSEAARIVMTYKLLKTRVTAVSIPRERFLATEIAAIRELFSQYIAKRKDGIKGNGPRTIGFILRHAYPITALSQPSNCLKSVDAVVHQLFSNQCEVLLAPVLLIKDNDFGVPYRDDPGSKRCVYLTGSLSDYVQQTLSHEDPRDTVGRWYPIVAPVQWIELGFGDVISRGSCLGNADCGARFSYTTSAMICFLDKASHWKRRRVAFLIQEKGFKGNMIQKIAEYYPIFRNVVYYL